MDRLISANSDSVVRQATEYNQADALRAGREQSGSDGGHTHSLRWSELLQRFLDLPRHWYVLGHDRGRQRDAGIERLIGLLLLLRAD